MLDEEMIILLRKNPELGLEEIMDQYMSFVWAIVYSKLANQFSKQDIEECVSDVFFEIHQNRYAIDLRKGSFKAYLAVISKRRAIDYFRRKMKESKQVIPIEDLNQIPSAIQGTVESISSEKEMRTILIDEIQTMGEPDREIFIRKYFFGQSTKLISKALCMKENTIDKRVSRGLDKLKQSLGGAI